MSNEEDKRILPRGITRCKDGRYQGRYTYEGHRYCIYSRNINELEEKLNDIRYEINHGIYAKQEQITLNTWYKTWITEYKALTVKKGTLESYQSMYDYYIRSVLGKKLIKDIRGEHIQKLLNSLCKEGYSKSTISLLHVLLKSLLEQAKKNELIKKNPVDMVTVPRIENKKQRRVLSIKEQEILLQELTGNELEILIRLGLATGMRIGELTGLEWCNIDFEKKEIKVSGTLKCSRESGEFYKDTPKTEKSCRVIPILPRAEQLLKKQRLSQREQKLVKGKEWSPVKGLENLVFTRENGRPVAAQHIRQQMVHIAERINRKYYETGKIEEEFKSFTPHTLRHTFATRALENGIPPKVVQEILGHSSITMTLDLYTHVLPKTKADEMKKMAALF